MLKGRVTIQLRSGNVILEPGEMFVVPKGVEHCPMAEEEAHILLIEPTGYPNTGDRAGPLLNAEHWVSRARGRSLTLEVLATLKPLDEKVPPIPRPEAEPVEL